MSQEMNIVLSLDNTELCPGRTDAMRGLLGIRAGKAAQTNGCGVFFNGSDRRVICGGFWHNLTEKKSVLTTGREADDL